MKLIVIVAVLLACSAVHANYGMTPSHVDAAWEDYQAHFPVDAKSVEDATDRKANFAKAHAAIDAHNKKNSTFQRAHNKFSAMSDEEKKAFIGAHAPSVPADARFISLDGIPTMRQAASVDYRTHTCMQAVKNQGSCGSCWAFSATAVTEFGKCIKTGTKVALSEQQLVDCSTSNYGCNGGWYDVAWQYLAKAGGQATSATYSYTSGSSGTAGTCKYPGTTTKGAVVSATSPAAYVASKDTTTMMTLLAKKNLVSVAIAVVNSFFSYSSGVYTEPNCGTNILGYHAMAVVGYGTLNGLNYWIIRNSWSSGWGASGYILFQRGVNLCGVEDWAATTTMTA